MIKLTDLRGSKFLPSKEDFEKVDKQIEIFDVDLPEDFNILKKKIRR